MKRHVFIAGLIALILLPMAIGNAAGPEPNPELEPEWKAKAAKQLKAYPKPEDGMVRYVLYLEPKADESLFQVELFVGKTIETDGVNHYRFVGQMEQENIKGWGYTRHVVPKNVFDNLLSTRKGVPPGTPKVKEFVTIGGGPYMVRYNSKLPIVVYVPAGGEVRYRVWQTQEQGIGVTPG